MPMNIALCDDLTPSPNEEGRDPNLVLKELLASKGHTPHPFNGRNVNGVAVVEVPTCAQALADFIRHHHCAGMTMDLHWWDSVDPDHDFGLRLLEELHDNHPQVIAGMIIAIWSKFPADPSILARLDSINIPEQRVFMRLSGGTDKIRRVVNCFP